MRSAVFCIACSVPGCRRYLLCGRAVLPRRFSVRRKPWRLTDGAVFYFCAGCRCLSSVMSFAVMQLPPYFAARASAHVASAKIIIQFRGSIVKYFCTRQKASYMSLPVSMAAYLVPFPAAPIGFRCRIFSDSQYQIKFSSSVESSNSFHLFVRQRKVKDGDVFADMVGIGRSGNSDDAALQIPAQDHLHCGTVVRFGCFNDCGIAQNLARMPSAAERIPRLHDNAQIVHIRHDFPFLTVDMDFVLRECLVSLRRAAIPGDYSACAGLSRTLLVFRMRGCKHKARRRVFNFACRVSSPLVLLSFVSLLSCRFYGCKRRRGFLLSCRFFYAVALQLQA